MGRHALASGAAEWGGRVGMRGYKGSGKGKEWIEKELGRTAELVQHPPKPRGVWAPADVVLDWSKVMPPPGFRDLPRR